MADHRAAQEIAVAGGEPLVAGLLALEQEVLGVGVEGVLGGDGQRVHGRLVGAQEVAHVYQPAVVGMVDGEDQLLHAVRVLHDVAVVLGAGADALPGGVLGHLADGILRAGDDLAPVEVAPPGHVVADDLRAQMLGHVDLGLELGNHVGVFDEIRPDGIGDDGQADGFAVGANFVGQRAQIRRGLILRIEIDELDAVGAQRLDVLLDASDSWRGCRADNAQSCSC